MLRETIYPFINIIFFHLNHSMIKHTFIFFSFLGASTGRTYFYLPDHKYYVFFNLNHSMIKQACIFFRSIDREDIFLGGCLQGLVTVSVRRRRKLYPQTHSQLTRGQLHQDCGFWPQKTTRVLGKKSFKIECRWKRIGSVNCDN